MPRPSTRSGPKPRPPSLFQRTRDALLYEDPSKERRRRKRDAQRAAALKAAAREEGRSKGVRGFWRHVRAKIVLLALIVGAGAGVIMYLKFNLWCDNDKVCRISRAP